MKLRGAMLFVRDLQRMNKFYAGLLGSNPINRDSADTRSVFETDGARFTLHAIPAAVAKNIEITSPPTPRQEEPIKLIFEVNDVEAERARLESQGAQVMRRPWQKPGEAFDATDPEGNVFQVCAVEQARLA